MKLDKMARTSIATLTLIGSLTGGANAATLMNTGFEDNTLSTFSGLVSSFSANQGIWGAENGNLTGTVGNINPIGTQMHGMTLNSGTAQTIQFVDLSAHAGDITAGNAILNFSAHFNIDAAGATGSIGVRFFSADNWPSAQISFPSGPALALDADPSSWEQVAMSTAIPTNATWVGVEVQYTPGSGTGYVDDTALSVTAVPEPSSTLLLGLGSLALAFRRSRR